VHDNKENTIYEYGEWINDLTKQRNEADTELNELYTKWEELSEED